MQEPPSGPEPPSQGPFEKEPEPEQPRPSPPEWTAPPVYPSFLDAARQGRHSAGRYLLGILFVFFFSQFFSIGPALVLAWIFAPRGTTPGELQGMLADPGRFGPLPGFLFVNIISLFLLLGVMLAVLALHRRPPISLITGARRVSMRRILQGFGVWMGLAILASAVDYAMVPESYTFQFDARLFFPFLLLALVLTPLQTTGEELFFRGYVVQGFSLVTRRRLILSMVSGVFFMVPHFANPEMEPNPFIAALAYFVIGFALAFVSLRDGTLELAIGAHFANNLFSWIIVNYEGSVLPTPSLFFTSSFDPHGTLIGLLISTTIFYGIFFPPWKRRPPASGAFQRVDASAPPSAAQDSDASRLPAAPGETDRSRPLPASSIANRLAFDPNDGE